MDQQARLLLDILEQHGRDLHRLLFRLTLRADVAEDLLQDLFVKLQRSPGFFESKLPAAYARRAAMHLAFDWRRQEQRRKKYREFLGEEMAVADHHPADAVANQEQAQCILRLLDQLPPLYRDCVLLRYLHEQEYASIAAQVGKTEHQVRAICSKAIKRLRDLLRTEPSHPRNSSRS